LMGKHLKQWSVRQAIHTDIFRRALPWSRLMIAREGLGDDLNTSKGERVRAVLAGLWLLSPLVIPFAPALWWLPFALLALALAANVRLFRFFLRHLGFVRALAALTYHQIYYVYSAAAFAWCLFEYHILGIRNRLHVP
ncbi:MAG: hypothetical protein ORN49_08645, partial [Rhodobacteraceae bacterium]|nr:hypothetical protein [Paracoccaceae bacterium]